MASVARSLGSGGNEWLSTLIATGCEPGSSPNIPRPTPADVIDYLVRDPDNPSSIVSCLETARRNARAVRTALTVDMWDALNETWLEARERAAQHMRSTRCTGLPRMGARALAALQRRLCQHHAAQRRLSTSPGSAPSSSAPTTRRASSTSNTTCCCRRTRASAARSTITSGSRSCARSRRCAAITGSITSGCSPGSSPSCCCCGRRCRAR